MSPDPGPAVLGDHAWLGLVEALGAVVCRIDPVTLRCRQVSPSVERTTGWTQAQWLQPDFWIEHLHPDDLVWLLPERSAALAATGAHRADYRMSGADGGVVWFSCSVRTVRTVDGEIELVAVMLDITGRRQREAALDASQRFLQAVLDSLTDAVVACDATGTLTVFNPAASRLHGLPAAALPVEQWAEHYDLRAADGVTPLAPEQVPLARALRGELVREVEMVVTPVGAPPRSLLASGQQILAEDGAVQGAVVAMHDVTQQRVAETLREEQAALRSQQVVRERSVARLRQLNLAAVALSQESASEQVQRVTREQAVLLTGAGRAAVTLGVDVGPTPSDLEVELVARDGAVLGRLQVWAVSGGGALEPEDEAALAQLAQLSSLALARAGELEREHLAAVELQHALLPQSLPRVPGLDAQVAYLPGRGEHEILVGGDWYDLFELAPDLVALALGDVVGHGLRSASLMGQVRSALRGIAVCDRDPVRVVTALDQLVGTLGDEQLATLAYGTLHLPTRTLRLVLAGHPPPLLRVGADVTPLEVEPGLPLGALPGGHYPVLEMVLPVGSTLLLFSDGLVESRSRPVGEGLLALTESLRRAPEDLAELTGSVLRDLTGDDHDDDVALLAVRPVLTGPEARSTHSSR